MFVYLCVCVFMCLCVCVFVFVCFNILMVLFPLWGRSDGLTLANFPTWEQLSSRINKKRWETKGRMKCWGRESWWRWWCLWWCWWWPNLRRRPTLLYAHSWVQGVQPRCGEEAEIIHRRVRKLRGSSKASIERDRVYPRQLHPRSSIIQGVIICKKRIRN
jgi:hypothetical protein